VVDCNAAKNPGARNTLISVDDGISDDSWPATCQHVRRRRHAGPRRSHAQSHRLDVPAAGAGIDGSNAGTGSGADPASWPPRGRWPDPTVRWTGRPGMGVAPPAGMPPANGSGGIPQALAPYRARPSTLFWLRPACPDRQSGAANPATRIQAALVTRDSCVRQPTGRRDQHLLHSPPRTVDRLMGARHAPPRRGAQKPATYVDR